MVLTPIDFYYLLKELKKIEESNLKKIYKSENNFVFEFKKKKDKFYLVVGKNFCYLDDEKPEETEAKGFVNFLFDRLKDKRLIKIEQNDFNKILVLHFSDFDLILEFIGKGNIILCQDNKITGCLYSREFKDRKVLVEEEYKFPVGIELGKYLKTKDENLLNEIHIGKIYKEEILSGETLESLLNKKPLPYIYFKENEMFFVSPFKIETLQNLKSKEVESFSKAIREFFSEKKKTKTEIIKEGQKKNLNKCLREEEKFREEADLLLKYKPEIETAVREFKKEKRIVEPIKEIVEKRGIIILELGGIELNLNINAEVKDEINLLYKKSKKARKKIERIKKLLPEKIGVKEKMRKTVKGKKEWYEQFRYFYTSDSFLIVAGKDTDTNEKLIKKYCKRSDIVLHAHIPGSPFGVIRSEGKEITKQAIEEAAQFVACYSRFWISKLGIADVYWVKPEQVSKTAKGHIKKGSFMIYGKRNFLRVELKILIGVNEDFEVVKYPANSLKKPKNFVVIVPGEKEGKELAELIKLKLTEKAKKEDKNKILEINPDEFLRIVPYGKGDLLAN